MSKTKFSNLIKIFLIFFFFISLFLVFPKEAKAVRACNLNNHDCVHDRSCDPPNCHECQWCPEGGTPFPQINNPVLSPQLRNLSGFEFVQRAVTVGVTLLLIAGAVVFVFIFLIGGIRWITSGGDKAAMEGARNQVTHALIGLAILLSVFAIIQLLGSIFGISLTKLSFPTL